MMRSSRSALVVALTARACALAPAPISDAALRELGLYVSTPLLRSAAFSELLGAPVWLKLDALQPGGSLSLIHI